MAYLWFEDPAFHVRVKVDGQCQQWTAGQWNTYVTLPDDAKTIRSLRLIDWQGPDPVVIGDPHA